MQHSVLKEPLTVASRLRELDLTAQVLRGSILEGETNRDTCTAFDPPTLPGTLAWGRSTRALRERLVPDGWESREIHNLPVVIHPTGEFAVAVSSADAATGFEMATPKTKNPKGRVTAGLVERNSVQMDLQMAIPAAPTPDPFRKTANILTYFLLFYRDTAEARVELSLPHEVGDDFRVDRWSERIILEPIDLSGIPLVGTEEPEEIEVVVRRK